MTPRTLGTRGNSATPLVKQRPSRVQFPHEPPPAFGQATPTNRSNPTAPAGSDPRNVDLLTTLEQGTRQ